MSHFLLALRRRSRSPSSSRRGVEPRARPRRRPSARAGCAWSPLVGVAACAALVVTGAVATASGPHSGRTGHPRLGLAITDTVYVHVRATAVFGIGLLVVGCVLLWRLRRELPGHRPPRLAALLVVLLVQMVVGEVQYRNALPWWLVARSTSRSPRRSGR